MFSLRPSVSVRVKVFNFRFIAEIQDPNFQAKAIEYLKIMKGLEPMLENARKGLPVDIRKIPPPPDYDQPVLVEMSGPRPPLARQDSSSARLLHDFADQLKKARSLTNQFTQLGSLDKGKISFKSQN